MTTSELMKAMADAGAPFEAILIAVQALDAKDAEIARREQAQAEKRAKDAERKRKERANALSEKRPRTVRGRSKECPKDAPPIDNTHTPQPDISPDGESQSAQRDECAAVVSKWNAMASANSLPACQKLSPARRKACQARLRDDGLAEIQRAIERVPKSSFLLGQTGNWSGANIDFLLRPDTVTKILEGKYDDRSDRESTGPRHGSGGRPKDGAIAAIDRRLGLDQGSGDPWQDDYRAGQSDRGRAIAGARTLF